MAEALTIALAAQVGRVESQQLVKAASERALRDGITLKRAAVEDSRITGVLSADDISQALNPSRYVGSSDSFIDRALGSYRILS